MAINLYTMPDVAVNRRKAERAAERAELAAAIEVSAWFSSYALLSAAARTEGLYYGVLADEQRSEKYVVYDSNLVHQRTLSIEHLLKDLFGDVTENTTVVATDTLVLQLPDGSTFTVNGVYTPAA